MDVGNLIHAEEHGVVWTPLPVGFAACKGREDESNQTSGETGLQVQTPPTEGARGATYGRVSMVCFTFQAHRGALTGYNRGLTDDKHNHLLGDVFFSLPLLTNWPV